MSDENVDAADAAEATGAQESEQAQSEQSEQPVDLYADAQPTADIKFSGGVLMQKFIVNKEGVSAPTWLPVPSED